MMALEFAFLSLRDGFGDRLFDEFAKAFVSFQLVRTHNRSVRT